jgi:uncharacterized protein (DUF486 family)
MTTVLLLILSNIFMTFAWYYHISNQHLKAAPLWIAILASWGIAFFEYCFQVPANRIGYTTGGFTMTQLKTIQEIVTLSVFAVFAITIGKETLRWNHAAAALCLVMAAYFVFAHRTSQ